MNEMTFDEAIEALQHAVYGEEVRYAIARALVLSMNTQQSVAGKENSSNKKTTLTGNESSNQFYPTTKAVADALSTKAPASTAYTIDSTTTTVVYNANNPKKIYTNAYVDNKDALVLTTANNYYQIALCYDGTEYTRHLTAGGSTTYTPWVIVRNENANNKESEINDSNRTSTDFYPSIKAVYDFVADILTDVEGDLVLKENLSNKKNAIAGNETSNQFYPTTKAVADALSTKAPASTAYTFDTTTTNVVYNANNQKTIYLNARVDNKDALVLTTSNNYYQIAFCYDGTEYTRHLTNGGSTTYNPWLVVKNENANNKKSEINDSNRTSTDFYPSIKAVADALSTKAPLSAAYTFDATTTNVVYDANNPKKIYLNATVDGENGIVITAKGNDFQYFFGRDGSIKTRYWTGGTSYSDWYVKTEKPSNKADEITNANKTSNVLYPSIKAVVNYVAENYESLSNIADLKAYIGYTDGDILGLHADFENKVFTRLSAAVGLTAGQDFNAFPMYGQRRRVVVESDGVIIDGYSPEDVGESDTDVDVMVYQPKFYYKVVPLKLEKQSSGLGYHIRKANYYISSTPHAGFKLHPLFFDKNGNEIDYVLFSAYEASYLYPTESGFDYFHDGAGSDTGTSLDLEYGVLKSMPNVKPISGQYKAFNKTNAEILAQNKSSNWHLDTIQSVSANQLLMAIEYGTFNTQNAIGMGIVSNASSNSYNCSSLTGSTSAETFNTASGMASETIYDIAGAETTYSENGKVAVSYRGMENPWGNIWKQTNGINIWGNGSMGGGQPYISDDFHFNEEVKGETTINNVHYKYSSAGFSLANANGWISAFGYGKEEYDWLFLSSETTGNSSVPVSDNHYGVPDLNNSYRVLRYGGRWSDGYATGGFCCSCGSPTGNYSSDAGGRLLFVPTAHV